MGSGPGVVKIDCRFFADRMVSSVPLSSTEANEHIDNVRESTNTAEIKELEALIKDDVVGKSATVLEKLNSDNGQAFFGIARGAKKVKEQFSCDAVVSAMNMLPEGDRDEFKNVSQES